MFLIKRFQSFLYLFFILLSFFSFSSCSTKNHLILYKTSVLSSENLIPGLEEGELEEAVVVRVYGLGLAPEKGSPAKRRYYAERAAVLDGYRKLAERINGVLIDAYARSNEGDVSMDRIYAESKAYLKGAQLLDVNYSSGTARAELKLMMPPRYLAFQLDPAGKSIR